MANNTYSLLGLLMQQSQAVNKAREDMINTPLSYFARAGENLKDLEAKELVKSQRDFTNNLESNKFALAKEQLDFAKEQEKSRLKQQEFDNNLKIKHYNARNELNPLQKEQLRTLKFDNDLLETSLKFDNDLLETSLKSQRDTNNQTTNPQSAQQSPPQEKNESLNDRLESLWLDLGDLGEKKELIKLSKSLKEQDTQVPSQTQSGGGTATQANQRTTLATRTNQQEPSQAAGGTSTQQEPSTPYFEKKYRDYLLAKRMGINLNNLQAKADVNLKGASLSENIRKFRDIQTAQEAQREVLRQLEKESGTFNGIGRKLSEITGNLYPLNTEEQKFATANGTMLDLIAKQIYGNQLSAQKEANINKRYGVGGVGGYRQNLGKMIQAKEFLVKSQRDILEALKTSGASENQMKEYVEMYDKNTAELNYLKNTKKFNYKKFIDANK